MSLTDLILILSVCAAIWFGLMVLIYRLDSVRWWFWIIFSTLVCLAAMLLIYQLAWKGIYLAPR